MAEWLEASRRWVAGAVTMAIAGLVGWYAGSIWWVLVAVVVGGGLYWLLTTDRALGRLGIRRSSRAPDENRSQNRTGLLNRQGGVANVSEAKFGVGLDTAVDNSGEVDASHAEFGTGPTKPK